MRMIALALFLAAAGCATARPPAWLPCEGTTFMAPRAGFEVQGPPGWMRRNVAEGVESFIATRNGTPLQRIVAGSTDVWYATFVNVQSGVAAAVGRHTGSRPAGEGPHERTAVPHVMRHVMKPERT